MASNSIVEQVTDPDDPGRCQGSVGTGQCPNKAEPESRFCRRCDPTALARIEKAEVNSYRLNSSEAARRLEAWTVVDTFRRLSDTLAAHSMLIERALNSTDRFDLAVATAVDKLHQSYLKTVKEMIKLRMEYGQVLTKEQNVVLWEKIRKEIRDGFSIYEGWEEVMQVVGERVLKLINDAYGGKFPL